MAYRVRSRTNNQPHRLAPGRLRHKIDIESATTPTSGEPNPSYSTYARSLWAEVIETGGGEYIRGRQVEAHISALVTIRYRNDINPTMRIKYGSRYLNILSVIDPTGYRSELVLSCQEVQP